MFSRHDVVGLALLTSALTLACSSAGFTGGSKSASATSAATSSPQLASATASGTAASANATGSVAASGSGNASGSGSGAIVSSASGSGSTAATDMSVQASSGTVDISKNGFQCPHNMSDAVGAWSGTYTGKAVANIVPVNGTVNFAFAPQSATALEVNNFGIAGGLFGGDQIQSIVIDFQLNCGDLALHDATVDFQGKQIAVSLAFSSETWNPPTLTGTWTAHAPLLNLSIASGTWSVQKN